MVPPVFRRGCKPNSVFPRCRGERTISLSDHTRDPFRRSGTRAGHSRIPYLALLPTGFSVPPRSRSARWALTPPFHPYHPTFAGRVRRYVLCGTVRRRASRPNLPRVSPDRAGVARRRALWSSDFPPLACARSDPPPLRNAVSMPPLARPPQEVMPAPAPAPGRGSLPTTSVDAPSPPDNSTFARRSITEDSLRGSPTGTGDSRRPPPAKSQPPAPPDRVAPPPSRPTPMRPG